MGGAGATEIVATPFGAVRGVRRGTALVCLGLPYARAERFGAPALVAAWGGTRDARAPGPACPQPTRLVGTFTHGAIPAADEAGCLSLNVFTPALDGRRPVFVWVHGGGFTIGHGAASLYDGTRLAEALDAVVVTVNYRLGSFGWLSHPDLPRAPGEPDGNFGLLDLVAALRFVGQSIAAFGGDPAQVTVAGQSGGALIALDLLAHPGAAGLFARLALHSPPLVDLAQPTELGSRWAEALSEAAGSTSGFDRGRLAALPPGELVALHERLLDDPRFRGTRGAIPTLAPATLPVSPLAAPDLRSEVPILVGSNAEEGTFFFGSPWRPAPPPQRIPAIVGHLVPDEAPEDVLARRRAERPAADDTQLLVDIATEAMFDRPITAYAADRAAAGGTVYRYRFERPVAGSALRATHTAEVPVLFGTWADGEAGERLGGAGPDPSDLAAEMQHAWRGFVHGGQPGWQPGANRTFI